MSIKIYKDDCPGCRPVAFDTKTMRPLPDDHPLMVRMARAWKRTTRAQRVAWHNVTCLNSRDPQDLAMAQKFISAIQQDA